MKVLIFLISHLNHPGVDEVGDVVALPDLGHPIVLLLLVLEQIMLAQVQLVVPAMFQLQLPLELASSRFLRLSIVAFFIFLLIHLHFSTSSPLLQRCLWDVRCPHFVVPGLRVGDENATDHRTATRLVQAFAVQLAFHPLGQQGVAGLGKWIELIRK
jgi:hypothetical protein